jgi:hypothetical protein
MKGIPFVLNIETKKPEKLLGLTTVTPLEDVCDHADGDRIDNFLRVRENVIQGASAVI